MVRIAILNEHLRTFGGGERATYALASTLARAGHAVDVVTTEAKVPDPARIARFFGPGHDGFRIRSVPPHEVACALRAYTVLVNHSSGSTLPNPCPLGIYFVMFPDHPGGPWVDTYQHFVCNSRFTERHTRRRWGSRIATRVVYPAVELDAPAATKAREILAVGRFNAHGHRKNQAFLVDTFERLAGRLPPGWSLGLLGKVNPDRASLTELLELAARTEGAPVRLLLDVTDAERRAALARAAIFWHATGALAPVDAPGMMEHFGIAVVEAMAAGAVPVCFDGGGPREIIEHGDSGFLFGDVDALAEHTEALAHDPSLLDRMSARARARAGRFSRRRFEDEVNRVFSAVIAA